MINYFLFDCMIIKKINNRKMNINPILRCFSKIIYLYIKNPKINNKIKFLIKVI